MTGDQFDTEVLIHSPNHFIRGAGKVRATVSEGLLVYKGAASRAAK